MYPTMRILNEVRLPLLLCLTHIATVALAAAGFAAGGPEERVVERVEMRAKPFPLADVRLLDGPFRDAMDRDRQYLLALEADRLLHMFRVTAGVPAPAEAYGGWEQTEVRGHTMGHYLSACALMYASTGDESLRQRVLYIVEELGKCQQALGVSGYLSAFPESFIDRVEARQQVWAPYYTLHKIMAGLLDAHTYCGSAEALQIVERMAQWCRSRCDRLSDQQMQDMLNATEQGGMNEVLANLAAVTGNADYLALSRRFVQRSYVEPLAARRDELQGQHVNSFIPNIVGTARQYELTGDRQDRAIAEFFWNQVTHHRCYCTGGTSNLEHWRTEPGKLASELGDHTQETCCTYNMLKLTGHLFSWDPRAEYADYYERALWNSILSTQDPHTGMMMYFVTLAPGRWKYFNRPTDAFWCCTGTGLENHAKYGESIYSHDPQGVLVNQFIASEVNWRSRGVRLRQETRFPREPSTRLVVSTDQPVDFALRLRIPGWVGPGCEVRVNGEPIAAAAVPASYVSVERTWRDGDRVDMDLPMPLTVWPMPDDGTVVAFLAGPFVMAGKLGGEGLHDGLVYTAQNFFEFPEEQIAKPPILLYDGDDVATCLRPVPGKPLEYQTVGSEPEVTLVPYHELFGQRYAVYWKALRRGSSEHRQFLAEEAEQAQLRARTVDEVLIGQGQSERTHGWEGERSRSGSHLGRRWRDAADGGYFAYRLAVDAREPLTLRVTYWGSDAGSRVFDLLVDGVRLATQTLDALRPGEFVDVDYPLPLELIEGKDAIVLKFQAHPGHMAGGVFGCRVLKAVPSDPSP